MKQLRALLVGVLMMSFIIPTAAAVKPMKLKANDQVTQTSEKVKKAEFKMKDSQVEVGGKWQAETNFDLATDENGKKLTWKDISEKVLVAGEVDTNKVGTYDVTFTYNKIKQPVKVKVIDKKISGLLDLKTIKVKDMEIKVGQALDPVTLFESAEKKDGTFATWEEIATNLNIENNINSEKVGVYTVTFTYGKVTATSKVSVVENKPIVMPTTLNVFNSTLLVGDKWAPSMNFESILLSNDQVLTWNDVVKDIVVGGNVDTEKVGDYPVTYTYGDITQTINVQVKEDKKVTTDKIIVKNTDLSIGDKWEAKDNFEYILLSDGTKLSFKEVEKDMVIVGQELKDGVLVDTKKAGTYKVDYTYDGITATAVINVKANEVVKVQEISVKDTNLPTGEKWEAKDNFNYVLMSDGTKRTFEEVEKDLKVSGEVKNNIPGTYKVNYAYGDKIAVATVTVKDMEVVKVQEISVKDTNLPTGEKWEAEDNFNYVLMSDGTKRTFKEVEKELKVSGEVKTSVPGKYKVTYAYGDKKATATVTVKDMEEIKVQEISVKDSNLPTGEKWKAEDNFNYVLMSDGTKRTFKEVEKELKVSGEVKTSVPGKYKVTYAYGDKKATATITVKNMEVVKVQEIIVKNTEITVGSKWEPKDNFKQIKMSDGTERTWKDVEKDIVVVGHTGVTGERVNTQKAGTYKVDYTYGRKTATATVTVKENKKTVVPVKPGKKLPQTGEVNQKGIIVLGLVIIVGIGTIVLKKMKKEVE
ncbi:MAG: bacterial Ig-like domain-containing protein [Vagococcus sp.]|uniref:bacterial Ig-like domain-containing protein n=1 Tax=Vagococcus sp. TaxID=1933889 RepID=UPI002FC5F189